MKRVALYGRVSTEEQSKYGFSISTQLQVLTEYIEKENTPTQKYIIYDSYLDCGFSGGSIKRPQLQRLLKDIEDKKIDVVIFTRLDRWFRSVSQYYKIQEILDKNKVTWICTEEDYETDTSSGTFKVNIMLSVSQQYKDTQSEKVKESLRIKVQNGYYPSGKHPYGFKLVKEIGGSKLVIDDEQRENMRLIIEHFKQTGSLYKTQRVFNELTNHYGESNHLNSWLKNSLLHGEYKGIKNFCESFITEEEHKEILSLMKKNIKSNVKYDYIFNRMLKCEGCGRTLDSYRQKQKSRSKNSNAVYYYPRYYCSKGYKFCDCQVHTDIREKKLEQIVLSELKPKLQSYIFEVESKAKNSDLEKTKKSIVKIEEQQKRLNSLYIKERITETEYEKQFQELEQQKRKYVIEPTANLNYLNQILNYDFDSLYKTLTNKEKRAFFSSFINYINIYKNNTIEIIFK